MDQVSKELTKEKVNLLEKAGYSGKAIEIYSSKISVGIMKNSDVALAYSGPYGDTIKLYLKIKDDVVEESTFQYLGCPASAICGSILTQIITGKLLKEAKKIVEDDVSDYLGGLPAEDCHCAKLVVAALHKTISKYEEKKDV